MWQEVYDLLSPGPNRWIQGNTAAYRYLEDVLVTPDMPVPTVLNEKLDTGINVLDPIANCFCLTGAVQRVLGYDLDNVLTQQAVVSPAYKAAHHELKQELYRRTFPESPLTNGDLWRISITSWNDHPDTSYEDVMAVLATLVEQEQEKRLTQIGMTVVQEIVDHYGYSEPLDLPEG